MHWVNVLSITAELLSQKFKIVGINNKGSARLIDGHVQDIEVAPNVSTRKSLVMTRLVTHKLSEKQKQLVSKTIELLFFVIWDPKLKSHTKMYETPHDI